MGELGESRAGVETKQGNITGVQYLAKK